MHCEGNRCGVKGIGAVGRELWNLFCHFASRDSNTQLNRRKLFNELQN